MKSKICLEAHVLWSTKLFFHETFEVYFRGFKRKLGLTISHGNQNQNKIYTGFWSKRLVCAVTELCFFLSFTLTFLPKGVIVGIWNFAWGFKSHKKSDLGGRLQFPNSPPSRHVHRKISVGVDGGLSGGSSVRRSGSEDNHRRQREFLLQYETKVWYFYLSWLSSAWPSKCISVHTALSTDILFMFSS